MRPSAAGILTVLLLAAVAAAAGEAPRPKDAAVVGTVAARRGSVVVVLAAKDGALRPGQELAAGRSRLLVAIARDKERMEAWGEWEQAGRVRLRLLRGKRCAIGFIISENARTGADGQPAPNIRPGDTLCISTTPPERANE